ncbi:hypothetical protein [Bradyrhizobium phage BDU-MI-1]|nr:hypothetical protein [Bradyrhizobium phage BDU-MI-1]
MGFPGSEDMRPQRYGWAPGGYLCNCHGEGCAKKSKQDRLFIGDKRATLCADCAYELPWPPKPVDRVAEAIAILFLDNQDKWKQALARPQLQGWFVGQVMKKLNGRADPDEVFLKVAKAFESTDVIVADDVNAPVDEGARERVQGWYAV